MKSEPWSKQLVIVKLPAEPHTYDELETVMQVAVNRTDSDIIIDLDGIEHIDQQSILSLIVLNRLLQRSQRHLGFCHIHPSMKETLQKRGFSHIEKGRDEDIVLEPMADTDEGGTVILSQRGTHPEKRHYKRLSLSKWLKISAELWHVEEDLGHTDLPPARYWEGILADVCEGGTQVVIDRVSEPDFQKGQAVRLRFAPIAYDTPATFDGQVREQLPTASGDNICLGLQFTGLEANPDALLKLQRLCKSGLRYFETTAHDAPNATPMLDLRQ